MRKTIFFFAIAIVATAAGFAFAGESVHSIELPAVHADLKPGDGKIKVDTYCAICHSTDYITMQPPFSKAQWSGTVTKMIKVFGAPIKEEDAKIIIDYLGAQYGTGK